jgi:hypothetical protein
MSTDEQTFTVTVTSAELDNLRRAMQREINRNAEATALEVRTMHALTIAKPVKKPRAAKPAEPAEELIPTGDTDLDAFIAKHHRPDWRARLKKALQKNRPGMVSMPSPAPGHDHPAMRPQTRADLYRKHNVIQHSA